MVNRIGVVVRKQRIVGGHLLLSRLNVSMKKKNGMAHKES